MPYLILSDYEPKMQEPYLMQVITTKTSVLLKAQLEGEEEVKSKLRTKYDVSKEFTNTTIWDSTKTYNATDRVYLDAPVYVSTNTYSVNTSTVYNGNYYIANTTTTGPFDVTKWELINPQYTIYYAQYPEPLFDYYSYYNIDDLVFWKNKIYKSLINTPILSHEGAIQYNNNLDLPIPSIAPDNIPNGSSSWQLQSTYTIPSGTSITNTNFWTQGDNRDQKIVQAVVDIVLYHLHARISPRNIPELRVIRYKGRSEEIIATKNGIMYPETSAKGYIQSLLYEYNVPTMPLLAPKVGKIINVSSNVKLDNSL